MTRSSTPIANLCLAVLLLGIAGHAMAQGVSQSATQGYAGNNGGFSNLKHGRADAHAPTGVMGDHVHKPGQWMVEYKFAHMDMDGNRAGSHPVDDITALDITGINFMVTPQNMSMDMHMFHFMYGWRENLTVYAMPMYMVDTMRHLRRPGSPAYNSLGPHFTTSNDGFADLPFGLLWRFYDSPCAEAIFNAGCSVPTGDIAKRTDAPSAGTMPPVEFPYPMRLGSGTFNFRPGITYKRYWCCSTLGVQWQGDLPVGKNYDAYRPGDEHRLNLWVTRLVDADRRLALTYRVENLWRTNYYGADSDLNPNMVSTARSDMRGGYWLKFGYGLIWLLPNKCRASFEITHPIAQYLDGVQLETDWTVFASLSKGF